MSNETIETMVTFLLLAPFVLMIVAMAVWTFQDVKADMEADKTQEERERRFRESGPDYGE